MLPPVVGAVAEDHNSPTAVEPAAADNLVGASCLVAWGAKLDWQADTLRYLVYRVVAVDMVMTDP